jgi:hypothetical protein
MAGLDPGHPRVQHVKVRPRKPGVHKTLFLQALLPEENMSGSSWSRRGVDGRVKPGHDDEGSEAQPQKARPTGIAISVKNRALKR